MKPVRIQRRRTKGWSAHVEAGNGLPVAYVNRPLKWGNPFTFPKGDRDAQARAVECFESALLAGRLDFTCEDVRNELRGMNLACFCRVGAPCHGDVLIKIANE